MVAGMTTPGSASERLLVLYDADCGICSHTARWLQRLDSGRRLLVLPLQSPPAWADAPPTERLMTEIHVRDRDGRWFAGGGAALRILRELPITRPVGWVWSFRPLRPIVDAGYRLVADHRGRIGRALGLGVCSLEPEPR
jgi:predicted DCC family thiol-disulfide oxidoreductase YuxK